MLKVGSPQPPMPDFGDMEQAPPTPPMEQDMMPMEPEPNPYENDFDAGVDADEEQDPKRYIQQLTGKLSQSLHKYNSGQPQPDADLNKYVAGMVNKQVADGLSEEDFDEILKTMGDEVEEQPNEAISRRGKHNLDELFQQLTSTEDDDEDVNTQDVRQKDDDYNKQPFLPPRFS